MTAPWFRAVAAAEPETWRVELHTKATAFALSIEAARVLHAELGAAIEVAAAQAAHEVALPLRERVWLYLARLVYMPPEVIARDLGAPEENVRIALAELVLAGRVEDLGDLTYKALGDRSAARSPMAMPASAPRADRGALIVAEASAGARVVDAREALARIPAHRVADHERARVRLAQAELDQAAARAALEAGGGR